MQTFVYIYLLGLHPHILYEFMILRIHTYKYTCICRRILSYICIQLYVLCMYVYIHTCMHVCIHPYILLFLSPLLMLSLTIFHSVSFSFLPIYALAHTLCRLLHLSLILVLSLALFFALYPSLSLSLYLSGRRSGQQTWSTGAAIFWLTTQLPQR